MNIKITHLKKIHHYQSNSTLCKIVLEKAEQLLQPGMNELELYTKLKTFIKSIPEIEGIWHPITVKFDQSTLNTDIRYKPSEECKYNEIAIIDVGLIAGNIELDDAKTFGITPRAQSLIKKTDTIMNEFKRLCTNNKKLSPSQAFLELCKIAKSYGVVQIADTAGHILGEFPTIKSNVKIRTSEEAQYFTPGSWMLEVHLSDGEIGCFKEELVFLDDSEVSL